MIILIKNKKNKYTYLNLDSISVIDVTESKKVATLHTGVDGALYSYEKVKDENYDKVMNYISKNQPSYNIEDNDKNNHVILAQDTFEGEYKSYINLIAISRFDINEEKKVAKIFTGSQGLLNYSYDFYGSKYDLILKYINTKSNIINYID